MWNEEMMREMASEQTWRDRAKELGELDEVRRLYEEEHADVLRLEATVEDLQGKLGQWPSGLVAYWEGVGRGHRDAAARPAAEMGHADAVRVEPEPAVYDAQPGETIWSAAGLAVNLAYAAGPAGALLRFNGWERLVRPDDTVEALVAEYFRQKREDAVLADLGLTREDVLRLVKKSVEACWRLVTALERGIKIVGVQP
jgi:hypothetical protein